MSLPIADYPEVTPPQIKVTTDYPGASAAIVSETVASPMEEEINGVDDMIYMSSMCDDTGHYELTVTFAIGTDRSIARVNVQNRIQQAQSKLPQAVVSQGFDVTSESGSILAALVFYSPNKTHNQTFMSEYCHRYVKDALKRIPGVGNATVLGPELSMRVWLDCNKLQSMGLGPDDVAAAISTQNIQATVGSVGASPDNSEVPLTFSLQAQGRLNEPEDFENIIVQKNADGGIVRLKDVGRVELGNDIYSIESEYNGANSVGILLTRTPGMNAVETMKNVRTELAKLSREFPDDMKAFVFQDLTRFINASIGEVVVTLISTFIIVALVCYVFLQDLRATLVPVIAIPVSVMSTFLVLVACDYSINLLSLFGLVLSIGVVVDNSIVIVERVIHLMEQEGMAPIPATAQAMRDVTGAIVASTLVLLAIFVPIAFLGGITGCIYRQFAVAISAAVVFSMVVALTLGPALCATILRIPKPKKHGPLAWFNTGLIWSRKVYVGISMWVAKRTLLTIGLLIAVIVTSYLMVSSLPKAFIPTEDQGVIFSDIKTREGNNLPQTKAILDKISERVLCVPGVDGVLEVDGFSIIGGRSENVSLMIISLADWDKRTTPATQVDAIMQQIKSRTDSIVGAAINLFSPPPIQGLGTAGGLDFRLQALRDTDPQKLQAVLDKLLQKINQSPEFAYAFSTYSANTPHIFLDINRKKAQSMDVPIANIFSTLQSYLGMRYVNDINQGSQTKQVRLQADWRYRKDIEAIKKLYVVGATGKQVPLGSLVSMRMTLAPCTQSRYNLYPSAEITAQAAQGYSSGQAMDKLEQITKEVLPAGYSYEWSGMSYQEKKTGDQIAMLLALSLMFGYLFLVAQYESWAIPIPIILSLSVAVLGGLVGLELWHLPMSIYAQLGIIMLVGVASKNAILIVEFAKTHREMGHSIMESAAISAHERYRAVLMTAFTFIVGVLPMVFATGAGANSRKALGVTIFCGMLAATTLGMLKIPALYVPIQKLREKIKGNKNVTSEFIKDNV